MLSFQGKKINTRLKVLLLVLLATAVTLSSLVILNIRPGTLGALQESYLLATTHQPESYTELFFEGHRSLPYDSIDGIPQTTYFDIVNHEAKPISYHYVVTETYLSKVTILASGYVRLNDQQSTRIPFQYTTTFPTANTLIRVSLVNRPESIYFWIQP